MKRIFIIASLAIMAVGCQKTEIQNEVRTPIGFSTETGKQTRAIVADSYDEGHSFGVFAYAYDKTGENYPDAGDAPALMDNFEIAKNNNTNGSWKVSTGTPYYWPNDPDNYLNFYAYSPFYGNSFATLTPDKTLHFDANTNGSGLAYSETVGLTLTAYNHSNMYVDFMVATPVYNATYTNQNGGVTTDNSPENVPVVFHHEMTQIIFNVKTNKAYQDVTFTLKGITLNNIVDKATYTNATLKPETDPVFAAANAWTKITNTGVYNVFPATTDGDNACPGTIVDEKDNTSGADNPDNVEDFVQLSTTDFTTHPVTMIPQTLALSAAANGETPAVYGQSFTIEYEISGTGVFNEKVEQTIEFKTANVDWTANKQITYNVVVGLHEITFAPEVANWGDTDESTNYIPETIDSPTNGGTQGE